MGGSIQLNSAPVRCQLPLTLKSYISAAQNIKYVTLWSPAKDDLLQLGHLSGRTIKSIPNNKEASLCTQE